MNRRAWIAWHSMVLALGGVVAAPGPAPGAADAAAPGPGNVPAVVISLDDAVQKAIRASPAIRAKEFEAKAIKANEITAGLIPNPALAAGVTNAQGTSQWSVLIAQTIELGGKRGRRIDSAEAATGVEGFSVDDLKRLVALQVKQAYVGIVVAKAQAEQTQTNIRGLDDQLRLHSLRSRIGDLSELDYLRIEQQRFQFESDLADAEQNLKIAKVNFRVIVGVDQIPETYDVEGTFRLKEFTPNREELYRMAEENRPDVRQAAQDLRRAQADNRLAQANAVPDLTPSIGYGWTSDRPDQIYTDKLSSANGNPNGNLLGFSIAIPLFSRNQGEIERTAQDARRVGVVRDNVLVQAHADVDVAMAVVANAKAKYQALRDNYYAKARTILERTELAYRQGGASLIDLLDATRQFRSVAFAFISAKGSYDAALNQLEAAIGGALP